MKHFSQDEEARRYSGYFFSLLANSLVYCAISNAQSSERGSPFLEGGEKTARSWFMDYQTSLLLDGKQAGEDMDA